MKIGILATGHVPADLIEAHGEYPAMFERMLDGYGFSFASFHVVDDEFPADIHECDGWLITGSAHGAYDGLPWIARLEDFIRQAYAAGVPLVGICFGHQIMAQALGGKVEKHANGWGVGRNHYRKADGSEFDLYAMHQDQVVVRPPDAQVTASSPFCENAAFAYKGNAISVQPHPEFSQAYMADLIRMRAGTRFSNQQADDAIAALEGGLDASSTTTQIAAFFKASARAEA